MSIKSKVFAAAATLTLVGGVGSIAALSADAATPSCGNQCLDLFSREFGTHHSPNYVLESLRMGAKAYIAKPFTVESLTGTVREALDRCV